jgi:hypothetical protein
VRGGRVSAPNLSAFCRQFVHRLLELPLQLWLLWLEGGMRGAGVPKISRSLLPSAGGVSWGSGCGFTGPPAVVDRVQHIVLPAEPASAPARWPNWDIVPNPDLPASLLSVTLPEIITTGTCMKMLTVSMCYAMVCCVRSASAKRYKVMRSLRV